MNEFPKEYYQGDYIKEIASGLVDEYNVRKVQLLIKLESDLIQLNTKSDLVLAIKTKEIREQLEETMRKKKKGGKKC